MSVTARRKRSRQNQLANYRKALEYCTYCPKLCRHSCPVSNATGRETLTPQSKMSLLFSLKRGCLKWSEDYVEPLYGCTSCGLCQKFCVHGNDVAAALREGRSAAKTRGVVPEAVRSFADGFEQRSHKLRDLLANHGAAGLGTLADAPVLMHSGCDAIEHNPPRLANSLALVRQSQRKAAHSVDHRQPCIGYPLWQAGYDDEARAAVDAFWHHVGKAQSLVLSCAPCTYLLREVMAKRIPANGPKPQHITEFLAQHAAGLRPRRKRKQAFYHDPCFLGRHLGVYQAPRQLLSYCVESTREYFHAQEHSQCCGGGVFARAVHPQAAHRQARDRLAEPQLFDARLVVTSCPTCSRTLQSVDSRVEVMDLIDLLAWSCSEHTPATG